MMLRNNADGDLKVPDSAVKKGSKAFSERTVIDHEDR
jgi:hypothetical protein